MRLDREGEEQNWSEPSVFSLTSLPTRLSVQTSTMSITGKKAVHIVMFSKRIHHNAPYTQNYPTHFQSVTDYHRTLSFSSPSLNFSQHSIQTVLCYSSKSSHADWTHPPPTICTHPSIGKAPSVIWSLYGNSCRKADDSGILSCQGLEQLHVCSFSFNFVLPRASIGKRPVQDLNQAGKV